MSKQAELFISVDVEAAGSIPGDYSMLSLGACVVEDPQKSFYVELKPLNRNAVPEALKISGFDLTALTASGTEPTDAMLALADWIKAVTGKAKPVFVGFNAGFDWSFVNWYFIHFVSVNPFGFAPLDIKSYYMGLTGCNWDDTRSSRMRPEFHPTSPGEHNALADAKAQAEMFRKMLTVTEFGEWGAGGSA